MRQFYNEVYRCVYDRHDLYDAQLDGWRPGNLLNIAEISAAFAGFLPEQCSHGESRS